MEFAAGKTTIEEKAAEYPRSPTLKIKSPVNGQNCHHETKHWQETMKILRVKQNSVEPTVRRRQYDDKKKLQSMHPPLVQCGNCNLT